MLRTLTFLIISLLAVTWPQSSAQTQDAAQYLRQAAAFFEKGQYTAAAASARQARELDAQLLPAWKLAGLSLQLAGQLAEAEAEFTQALKQFSQDAELWLSLARVQYQRSLLREAAGAARQALQRKPDLADAHAQLGLTLEAMGEVSDALASYQRAILLNKEQGRAKALPLYQAGNLLTRLGRHGEALTLLTEAESLEPRVSELRVARGRVLEALGRWKEAAGEYQQAITIDGNVVARSQLARLQAGATAGNRASGQASAPGAPAPIRFRNIAGAAKLNFTLRNSASAEKHLIETMAGGVAAFDYNNDGHVDLYFANGAALPALRKTSSDYWNRLWRNNGNETFTDVTAEAGVAGEGYAMGVAVADYDNDGHQDLFVTGVNGFTLFHNGGNGRFREVTARALPAASERRWSVAAAWLDYDNDGWLDLFITNYVRWRVGLDPVCGDLRRGLRTYCLPDRYEGSANQLFRNNRDGTFTDVSQPAGIAAHVGKGMGVAIADYDEDGFMDVFVANDTLPNFLFRNNRRGGFDEVALQAGVAFNNTGRAVSGMGVDFRDYDNDGRPDLILSALEGETFPLFRNAGDGFFVDATWESGLGAATIKRSGWGLGLFDLNNDGWKDLFTVNAHVNDQIEQLNNQTYRQSLGLFAGVGLGQFANVISGAGESALKKGARRGCAFADFNGDGQMDVVTTSLGEPAELLRNESNAASHWLAVRLIGKRSNRDAIGGRIKLVTGAGRAQVNHVSTSVGYASSSAGPIHFGLGPEVVIKSLEIHWPSGATQRVENVVADRVLTIREER